jgi:hypothetical protein
MFPWEVVVAVVWSLAVAQESSAGSWKCLRPASRPIAAHWSLLQLLCGDGVSGEGFEQQVRRGRKKAATEKPLGETSWQPAA